MSKKLFYRSIRKVTGSKKHFLHEPLFNNKEVKVVSKNVKTSFVSSAGKTTIEFEKKIKDFTKAKYCIAMTSGTSALQVSLLSSGVNPNDEVLVPALTFVGTANSISHCGAIPHFVDSCINDFGIDVIKLKYYLKKNFLIKKNKLINKKTKRVVKAIIPVHIFGHACSIFEINKLAKKYRLKVIEDAAEGLGSFYYGKHLGTFSSFGCLSFNGNKIITTGGGGAILTNNKKDYIHAKHLATTAKVPHKYKYIHDKVGYNYRMPSLNAALGIAQMNKIRQFIKAKRNLFLCYKKSFSKLNYVKIFEENNNSISNYWLQTAILDRKKSKYKKAIIEYCISKGLYVRPSWTLLSKLKPYMKCPKMDLKGAKDIEKRIINLPSSQGILLKKNKL